MFIRKKEVVNKKTGKKYGYYRLVESVATEDSVKQRTVLYLGILDISKAQLKVLSKLIEMRINGKREAVIFPELSDLADSFYKKYQKKLEQASKKAIKQASANYSEVDLNTVSTECHRSFGSEFVLDSFWRKFKMGQILSESGFSNKEKAISKALILGRLISPGSELHTYNWYQSRSSLNDFSGYDLSGVGKDAFYVVGDALLNSKEQIEAHLRKNIQSEYSLKDSIYLYDLTNTYFESSKPKSNIAKFGISKEKRYDCPLVTLALVVDKFGFPVYSAIYEGNKSEPQTLPEVLGKVVQNSYSSVVERPEFSIIMDRGIATADNIKYLKENGYSYFVIERRSAVKDFKTEFSDKSNFSEYLTSEKKSVFLRKIENAKNTQVLVYSIGKEQKEQAIIAKKEEHFIEDLKKLIASNHNGNVVRADVINRRIGRLSQRYGAVASDYNIKLKYDKERSERISSISYSRNKQRIPVKKEFAGCYVIETDKKDYSAKEIWDTYMQLHRVESAFRAMKSELGTRPIYHQKDDRIKSHLFLSVPAYAFLHSVEYELNKVGYNKSWETINQTLSTHQRSTVLLESKNDKLITIRVSSNPEKCHKDIYEKLNLRFTKNRKLNEQYLSL
jgi:transposase